MAVSVNATGTNTNNASALATSFTYSGVTVAAGSNSALVAVIQIDGGASTAASVTATWDNGGTNQAMTLIKQTTRATGQTTCIFGRRAPTTGNKSLVFTWTNTNCCSAVAVAFDGVDQVSDATAFKNATSATGTSVTPQVVVTSATGDIVVTAASMAAGAITSVNGTQLAADTGLLGDNFGAQYNTGAASVTSTYNVNASGAWAASGIDVAAVSGVVAAAVALGATLEMMGVG